MKLEAVVGEADVRGESEFCGVVVEVVGHVGEEGAARLQGLDQGDGFVEMRVAGVRVAAQSVEDEDVEVLEQREGFGWQVAHVGEVGGGAETVPGDCLASVDHRDALKVRAGDVDEGAGFGGQRVDLDAGAGGVTVDGAEGVVEDAADDLGGGFVGVERKVGRGLEGERAEVVHAEDVVGVVVGVEDGVEAGDVLANGLRVEIGAGVDEDCVAIPVELDGRTGAAIPGAGEHRVAADGAGAAERGDAHRGARAEEGEGGLHEREQTAKEMQRTREERKGGR